MIRAVRLTRLRIVLPSIGIAQKINIIGSTLYSDPARYFWGVRKREFSEDCTRDSVSLRFYLLSSYEVKMPNDWIIDVLTDLRRFAEQNGLNTLADHLDDTVLVAASELSAKRKMTAGEKTTNACQSGNTHLPIAARDNA
jgi:hypothetical protein